MITHRIIQPQFDQENRFLGFTNFILYDVNRIIDPNVTHDDLMMFMTEVLDIITPPNGININNIQPDEEVVARVNENNIPELRKWSKRSQTQNTNP